jgi:hypothetical protein
MMSVVVDLRETASELNSFRIESGGKVSCHKQ